MLKSLDDRGEFRHVGRFGCRCWFGLLSQRVASCHARRGLANYDSATGTPIASVVVTDAGSHLSVRAGSDGTAAENYDHFTLVADSERK